MTIVRVFAVGATLADEPAPLARKDSVMIRA
jgi:hypothetical protein